VLCLNLLWQTGHTDAFREGLKQLRSEGLESHGLNYLEVEAYLREGNFKRAIEVCLYTADAVLWGELAAHRVSQLARVCLAARAPHLALPMLRWWTENYPDVPDAGEVWLQHCLCAMADPDASLDEVRLALTCAQELLGDRPEFATIAAWLGSEDP
jgi:hypothetical protein